MDIDVYAAWITFQQRVLCARSPREVQKSEQELCRFENACEITREEKELVQYAVHYMLSQARKTLPILQRKDRGACDYCYFKSISINALRRYGRQIQEPLSSLVRRQEYGDEDVADIIATQGCGVAELFHHPASWHCPELEIFTYDAHTAKQLIRALYHRSPDPQTFFIALYTYVLE